MFKPLLDPYLGLYWDKFYFWTGLQLLIRAVFFSLSALDNKVSHLSGIIFTGILLCVQGVLWPYKSILNNIQESFALLILLLTYVITLYNYLNNVNSTATQYFILVVLIYLCSS